MKLFKETMKFLKSGEFFSGVLDRLFALSVSIIFIGITIYCFVYKPVILFYLLIVGMLVMGWFMLYFIFPDLHEWFYSIKRTLVKLISRKKR